MNWVMFFFAMAFIMAVIFGLFFWALVKAASDADDLYESYQRRQSSDKDPFDKPYGDQ